MLISLCKNRITLTRQTSEVFPRQTPAASVTVVNGTPLIDANIQITLTRPNLSDTKTGTITIVGTRSNSIGGSTAPGTSAADTIGVTANTYSSVTSVSVTGSIISSDIKIIGEYIGADGGNIQVQTTITSGWPAQITRKNESWPDQIDGTNSNEKPSMLIPVPQIFIIRQGDVVTNDVTTEQYLVVGTPLIENYIGNQFYRVMLEKRENSVI